MVKRKALVFSLIGIFLVLSMISTVNAKTSIDNKASFALGAGTFSHEHEGVPHNHYFAFSVSDGNRKTEGSHYKADGKFYMLATHEKEIHMIVKSDQIERFKITKVEGGLNLIFEGTATVKHMDSDWQKGWKFTVEAIDYRIKGQDSIHIMLTAPDDTEHHMEGTLSSGNILIKK